MSRTVLALILILTVVTPILTVVLATTILTLILGIVGDDDAPIVLTAPILILGNVLATPIFIFIFLLRITLPFICGELLQL